MQVRLSSVFILIATALLAVFFFKIVQPFILPIIFAGVLAVLVWPLYWPFARLLRGHRRIAAALTTCVVMLLILLPFGGGFVAAALHLVGTTQEVQKESDLFEDVEDFFSPEYDGQVSPTVARLRSRFTQAQVQEAREVLSRAVTLAAEEVSKKTLAVVTNLVNLVIGLVMIALTLYYFLAEKEKLLNELWRLSPLKLADDRRLADSFVRVCRGVMLGNVLAALLQAVLNALGFLVVGVEAFLLLGMLTFIFAMIPFLGAATIWIPVVLWLALEGRYAEAIGLGLYGALIVSSVDNLIRAYVVSDSSPIHPLVALVSILGALQLVGLWGIVIGPLTAAFFYALLNILSENLDDTEKKTYFPTSHNLLVNASSSASRSGSTSSRES